MAYCVLFHSACGLRPAVHQAAQRLVGAGHTVLTPDLCSGYTADNLTDGVALRDYFGVAKILNRAQASVFDVAPGAVYLGMSLGATAALRVAAGRGDAAGVVLLHGAPEPGESWTGEVPVAIHTAEPDPWVDRAELAAWRARGAEVHTYPGGSHLYTDSGLAEAVPADRQAAEQTWQRIEAFLAGLGDRVDRRADQQTQQTQQTHQAQPAW